MYMYVTSELPSNRLRSKAGDVALESSVDSGLGLGAYVQVGASTNEMLTPNCDPCCGLETLLMILFRASLTYETEGSDKNSCVFWNPTPIHRKCSMNIGGIPNFGTSDIT